MLRRSALGGTRRQSQKRTVIWKDDVEDNSKPLPSSPKVCMTDDEASKMSDEPAGIRRARKAQANQEIFDTAQVGASSSKAINSQVPTSFNVFPMQVNGRTSFNNFNVFNVDQSSTGQHTILNTEQGNINTFSTFLNGGKKKQQRPGRFEMQSSEDDGSPGQELSLLSDFAVDQAAQFSKLSEDEKKRQRALRFGAQSSQSQRSKIETKKSQEIELLESIVKDFIDTTNLYVQVQNAISKASGETISRRTRAWDYFDDGFRDEPKTESRVEPKPEQLLPTVDIEEVSEPEFLEPEIDPTPENDKVGDTRTEEVVDDSESSIAPVTPVSDPSEESPEVVPEKETIADTDRTDDSVAVDDESSDTDEEEIVPAFRFTTFCDLRDEVLGSLPTRSRREISIKRRAAFKKAAIKSRRDREPSTELLRRRKDRLAIFDANRANSIDKILSELDLEANLDTPAERLFRLEHPEYFPKEPTESREERLREYERARSAYDTHIAKLMAKQEARQEKVVRKRLRDLEDEELLREAKKIARQNIQEEMGWTPPSDTEIWKLREEKGTLHPEEEDKYDEKESDEENLELYYEPLEELPEPKSLRPSSLRRSEKALSYSELRRRVREKERNKKVQSELMKMQETARKCQIDDLRHQVLEEERACKRQKLVDLSNERDRLDSKTIQHIREVAASRIAIGRAIRELEDKIAVAEAELSRKRRLEDMVNDQSTYLKLIKNELQNGSEKQAQLAIVNLPRQLSDSSVIKEFFNGNHI